jgi:hypothetical protein
MANSIPQLLMSNFDNLITNIPLAWQYDSAAAPTSGSALDCIETCYWNYAIDPETGLSLAVTQTGDINAYQNLMRLDVLCGFKWHPQYAVKLLS